MWCWVLKSCRLRHSVQRGLCVRTASWSIGGSSSPPGRIPRRCRRCSVSDTVCKKRHGWLRKARHPRTLYVVVCYTGDVFSARPTRWICWVRGMYVRNVCVLQFCETCREVGAKRLPSRRRDVNKPRGRRTKLRNMSPTIFLPYKIPTHPSPVSK